MIVDCIAIDSFRFFENREKALLPDNVSWYLDRRFLIPVLSLVLIFPLCFPKDIGFLRHAALLGFMSCMFVVLGMVKKIKTVILA